MGTEFIQALNPDKVPEPEIKKSEQEWKKQLTEEQFYVTRKKGTERAFCTGSLHDNKKPGVYYCTCCNSKLFDSDKKFNSGTGWPSFWQVADKDAVLYVTDNKLSMPRVEVMCNKCHAHLGHVFNDGPRDKTGLRYCMNSCALRFEPK